MTGILRCKNDDGTSYSFIETAEMDEKGDPKTAYIFDDSPMQELENPEDLGGLASIAAMEIDWSLNGQDDQKLQYFKALRKLFRRNIVPDEKIDDLAFNLYHDDEIRIIRRALEKSSGLDFSSGKTTINEVCMAYIEQMRLMYQLMDQFDSLAPEKKKYLQQFCGNLSRAHMASQPSPLDEGHPNIQYLGGR